MFVTASLEELYTIICPSCKCGAPLRQRSDNQEWVHDTKLLGTTTHTICWATGLRNSKYADITHIKSST
jgi:hypothetical protein